jgi:hypothetical protein
MNNFKDKVEELQIEKSFLDSKLKSQVVIEKERIVYKTRVKDLKDNVTKDRDLKAKDLKDNVTRIPESVCDLLVYDPTQKVKTENRYLPPEGKAEINTDLNGNTTISIKSRGLCFEPCVSAVTAQEGIKIGIGARLAYWNRYGLSIGVNYPLDNNNSNNNIPKPHVAIDRRISDIVPFMRNTTVGIVYDGKLAMVLSIFF